ncbi:MAG: hypothetical protein LBP59_20625 [Planctomycetaceae bacterium]|nr:hypothetical protein [Planctomycetaceae bacterium]
MTIGTSGTIFVTINIVPTEQMRQSLKFAFKYNLYFKLFVLEFAFTFACLVFGRQALTLLNR